MQKALIIHQKIKRYESRFHERQYNRTLLKQISKLKVDRTLARTTSLKNKQLERRVF